MPTNPASYVVVNGRAYFTDDSGDLLSAKLDGDAPDLTDGESVIDLKLLREPTLAKSAGRAIDALRAVVKDAAKAADDTPAPAAANGNAGNGQAPAKAAANGKAKDADQDADAQPAFT